MPRDIDGNEIYVGDEVRCCASYYIHIRVGEVFKVDCVSGRCITSNKLDQRYGFDGRFLASNFRLVRPLNNHNGELTAYNNRRKEKGQTNMTCIAVRIDNSNPAEHLSAHIERIYARPTADGVLTHIHAEENYNELKQWIEQRIRENTSERWMIFQPSFIAESSSPPVRFKAL